MKDHFRTIYSDFEFDPLNYDIEIEQKVKIVLIHKLILSWILIKCLKVRKIKFVIWQKK